LAHVLWWAHRASQVLPQGVHRCFGVAASHTHPAGLAWHSTGIRARQDDVISWLLIPLLGFTIAGCALNAIIYGLMATEKWNAKFNSESEPSSPSGQTNWLTVFGVASSLLLGTTVLMASIVFSFQRYFESQIEQAKAISQGTEKAKP